MASRADVNRLSAAMRQLVRQAQGDIASFFYSWNITDPRELRDALLEIVPALVNEYGEIAAVAAAEWYEELRVVLSRAGIRPCWLIRCRMLRCRAR